MENRIEKQIDSFLEHFKRSASRAIEVEWCSAGRAATAAVQRSEDHAHLLASSDSMKGGVGNGSEGGLAPSSPRPLRNLEQSVQQEKGKQLPLILNL